MSTWNLAVLLSTLHDDIQRRLERARATFSHPDAKGDASEKVWVELFQNYLPRRYEARTAFIVDSKGVFSEQMDVVVFDRQYSPFILHYEGQTVVPAESVYAVFECKQAVSAGQVGYAMDKVASVRRLYRTSLPIPHAGGTYQAKPPPRIHGGLLTFDSDWNPPLGAPLLEALGKGSDERCLDLGCVAAHGYYFWDMTKKTHTIVSGGKPATAFLFKLISELQDKATVPMIDISAYGHWLSE